MPPPPTCVSRCTSQVPPHQSLPPGGRWPGEAGSDEERRNVPKRTHPPWLSLWESWRRSRLRGLLRYGKPLSAQCAHWAPLPKGEARRRAAAVNCETNTLTIDQRHWGSPGSLRLSSLGKGRTFRRAGACPRRPREFTSAPTESCRTKAFPLGGRWHGVSRDG